MKFIVGKKLEMTQRFTADGSVVPVTLVALGPCVVTQVKTEAKDGYSAVQIGYNPGRGVSKPGRGHLKDLEQFRTLREFRVDAPESFSRGQVITAAVFSVGDVVEAEGVSKGHGFQGVVKRHGFAGHPATHGHKDQLRMPGSIGSKRQGPVAPGKRMAGRMGSDQVTIKNLSIVSVDPETNIVAIKGALPGARGSVLLLSGPGTMELTTAVAVEEVPVVVQSAEEIVVPPAEVQETPAVETPAVE